MRYIINSIGQRTACSQFGIAFNQQNSSSATTSSSTSDTTSSAPSNTASSASSNMIFSTDSFTYNSRGEVISSTNDQVSTKNRTYNYDPIGNRLSAIECLTTSPLLSKNYSSNSLNQYIQISTTTPPSPSLSVPTYDLDGNMLSDGTGKLYSWDCENRLTQVTLPSGEIVQYTYDSQHRRVKREHISTTSTETTTYLYDEWNVLSERTTKITGENSTKTYTWGLDLSNTLQGAGGVGGLLSQIHQNQNVRLGIHLKTFWKRTLFKLQKEHGICFENLRKTIANAGGVNAIFADGGITFPSIIDLTNNTLETKFYEH